VNALKATVEQAGLSTRTQIASMQAKVEAQQAALNAAELNLRYGTILAPIAGRIGDTLIPVGGLVTPTRPAAHHHRAARSHLVRFKVTNRNTWRGRIGRTAERALPLTLIQADASQFASVGHIENSLNQMDPKTATLELQARFPNPGTPCFRTVRPCAVQVAERKNAILIPQKAIQQLQSVTTVFTVGPDNKVEVKPVTTGDRVGNSWIVERACSPETASWSKGSRR